jgi:tetratricopeptide (TPR) repeat protein
MKYFLKKGKKCMEQMPVEKYNIAWFRLAEYISRGEKERALGMYRLLCHSFNDAAFARQLEADILLSFSDTAATEKYYEAAQLYQQDNRLLQAVAVYENLHKLAPESLTYVEHLIRSYSQLGMRQKVAAYAQYFAEQLHRSKNCNSEAILEAVAADLVPADVPVLFTSYVIAGFKDGAVGFDFLKPVINKAVAGFQTLHDAEGLQQFLNSVQTLNGHAYEYSLSISM